MEKVVKALSLFWGIVISIIVLRYILVKVDYGNIVPTMRQEISTLIDTASTYKSDKKNEKDVITFPLTKTVEMVLEHTKSCIKDNRYHFYPKYLDTSSHCMNEECTISVSFKDTVPKKVGLYVEENGQCVGKYFEVASRLKESGTRVDLQLTEAQKNLLGISLGDEVRLRHANGYTLDSIHKYYYYDHVLIGDDIMVNNEKRGIVYFKSQS